MCVGCGRCLQRCPEEISFVDTINRLSEETDRLKGREAERTEEAMENNNVLIPNPTGS